jgi:hypothetical protein
MSKENILFSSWLFFLVLSTVLMQGCKASSDMATNGKLSVEINKFDPLYRATKEIEGTIKVGISYNDLHALVQKLSIEIEIARDRVTTEEEFNILNYYIEIFNCYQDSLTLWHAIIQYQLDGGGIPRQNVAIKPMLDPLVKKYGIKTEIVQMDGQHKGYYYYYIKQEESQRPWSKAREIMSKVTKSLYAHKKQ